MLDSQICSSDLSCRLLYSLQPSRFFSFMIVPFFAMCIHPRMLLQAFVDWCDEHDVDLSEALAL